MKVKLLRKIRREANNKITIYSITRKGSGTIIGMKYGFSSNAYSGLFDFGDTEQDVMRKVTHIYWNRVKYYYRKKYNHL